MQSQPAGWPRRRQVLAQFAASGAVLSEKESEGAYETRARMIDVIQHWLRDEGDIAVILAQLRQGSGHQVLANDLQTLAELYAREDVVAVISKIPSITALPTGWTHSAMPVPWLSRWA